MDEGQAPNWKIQIERHLSHPVRPSAEERIRGVPPKETPKVKHWHHEGNQDYFSLEEPEHAFVDNQNGIARKVRAEQPDFLGDCYQDLPPSKSFSLRSGAGSIP